MGHGLGDGAMAQQVCVVLSAAEREQLAAIAADRNRPRKHVERARIVEMCSAIQSSAASARSPTKTILTFEVPGGRIGLDPLETTKTLSPKRAATRYTSSRTGHASPST